MNIFSNTLEVTRNVVRRAENQTRTGSARTAAASNATSANSPQDSVSLSTRRGPVRDSAASRPAVRRQAELARSMSGRVAEAVSGSVNRTRDNIGTGAGAVGNGARRLPQETLRTVRGLGRFAGPFSMGINVAGGVDEVRRIRANRSYTEAERDQRVGEQVLCTTGSLAGGTGGAAAGAAAGAAIGSVVPVVGTVVGGVIGAIAGGYAGGQVGCEAGNAVGRTAVGSAVGDAVNDWLD